MPPKRKAAAPAAPVPPAGDAVQPTHYLVRALSANGFYRAGRYWPAEETRVSADELDDDQVEALMAEPKLVVLPCVDDGEAGE